MISNLSITFISCLFKINLLPKISTLIRKLYGSINWKISRITSMNIFPGSEEQEIHLDGTDVGNTKESSIEENNQPEEVTTSENETVTTETPKSANL